MGFGTPVNNEKVIRAGLRARRTGLQAGSLRYQIRTVKASGGLEGLLKLISPAV